MTVYAVLPACNEAENLPALLARYGRLQDVLAEPLQVVVVDDGSTDNTAEAARDAATGLDLVLLQHERNRGLGRALLTGLTGVLHRAQPDDVVITMDADNTHDPAVIVDLLAAVRERGLDVVVASRYVPGSCEVGVPGWRRMLSWVGARLYRGLYRMPGLHDYSCGFRALRAAVLAAALAELGDALLRERGFAATGELVLNLRHYTRRFGEVPFTLHYEAKRGRSKMRAPVVVGRTLLCLWRLRCKPRPRPGEKHAAGLDCARAQS